MTLWAAKPRLGCTLNLDITRSANRSKISFAGPMFGSPSVKLTAFLQVNFGCWFAAKQVKPATTSDQFDRKAAGLEGGFAHRTRVWVCRTMSQCHRGLSGYHHSMSDTAILVVDMMNSYDHPDADQLTPNVEKIIEPLTDLIQRARESDDVDLVYVNDNYGDFTAEFSDIVRSACGGARPDLVDPIVPTMGSRVVTKVRHSAFYATRWHTCGGLPRLIPTATSRHRVAGIRSDT